MYRRAWLFALWMIPASCFAEKHWYTKEACELMPNESNDGDSFHVKYKGKEHIYRLYFVDTPETDYGLPDRVAEQAAYFGIADPKDAIKVGKEAKDFTAKFLAHGFTVYTKGEDARGRSALDRDYGIVMAGDKDLAVALVEQGLARIYGEEDTPPTGPSSSVIHARLKSAEHDAKEKKLGAWALAAGEQSKFDKLNAIPDIKAQTLVLPRTTPYFSLLDGRHLGNLPQGKSLIVLRAESTSMVRAKFEYEAGKFYEVQCRRADLNL